MSMNPDGDGFAISDLGYADWSSGRLPWDPFLSARRPMKLPPLPHQRRRRQLILLGVAGLAVIWMGLAARSVFAGRSAALAGLDRLEAVRDGFEIEQLESGELTTALTAASDDFARARSNLRALWVTPLRIVPWVSTQIRSADVLSNSAATAAESLATATATVLDIKQGTQEGVINKAGAAEQLLALTMGTRGVLAGLELGPSSGLTGGLANARSRFEEELDDLDVTLGDAETAVAGITEFLSGPTTYLLLSANTSEMRAGSGRFLIAGPLEIVDGEVEVGRLVPPEEIILEPDVVTIADADFAANWSQLAPTTDLRNLGSTPRFDVTASLAADMWAAATGQPVDGVLVIDPVALQGVLGSGEPISVDGLTIDSSNVISHIVLDQYWENDTPTRRARQQELASAALGAVVGPGGDLIDLATALESAMNGRHILAWSASAAQQAAWEVMGVDGALGADSLMISLQNEGFNKLDTFIELDHSASSSSVPGGTAIEVLISIENSAGPELPGYVLGPFFWTGVDLGTYEGMLIVNLPETATDLSLEGPGEEIASGPDGPTQMLAVNTIVASMETIHYTLRFTLPNGSERVTIEPSARVPAARWSLDGLQWHDVAARTIDFEAGDYGSEPDETELATGRSGGEPTVPPSLSVQLNENGDTATIGWRIFPAETRLVVWDRAGSAAWQVLDASLPSAGELTFSVDPGGPLRCFRTSFSETATTFSSSSCIGGN